MQAILTRFIAPTNRFGPRIKAYAQAGSIMVPWQERVKVEYNHANAARALALKLGWTKRYYGAMRGGALPDGTGYAFVFDFNDTSDAALYCFAPDPVEEGAQS